MAPQVARSAQPARRQQPQNIEIPDRLYYRIGDMARICGVEPNVLRFWETQFPSLKPNKGGTGQRLYRRRELDLALRIKQLVHQEGYTLAGARQAMEAAPVRRVSQPSLPLASRQAPQRLEAAAAVLGRARAELRELSRQLAVNEPALGLPRTDRRRTQQKSANPPSGVLFPS